jgi:phage/plasmid-like protein (TIGR03299 family)
MSKETLKWLNTSILYGFQEKRQRNPWWYREQLQGEESSIYTGPIPREDVIRRLFSWEAIPQPLFVRQGEKYVEVPERHAITHGATGKVFVVASKQYVIHQYKDWLLKQVNDIFDNDELQIGSAGLLREGGQAFVSIERPDNITSRSGIELRPHFLATSSHDHKIATTYKFVSTIVVCDNTLDMALREDRVAYKARHTKNSRKKLETVRDRLDLLIAGGNDMMDFVDTLAEITVSDSQWEQIVEQMVSIGEMSEPKVKARLENKKEVFNEMWMSDYRCAPWRGSAFGVFQVFNTFRQHTAGKEESRMDRNMRNLFTATGIKEDRRILKVIEDVTKYSIIRS